MILKKINILENQIYDPKYVNQISALTRENVKLRRDTRILSSQVDLFVLAQKQTQKNKSDSSIQNCKEIRQTNMLDFYKPGSSNPNIAQLLNLHKNNNLLAFRLPPSEQIRLQPNQVVNENSNASPPIPPRPKNWPPTPHHQSNRHPSRSPPPPPKPNRNSEKNAELNNENNDPRWHCPRCTFANDENLNECEVCNCAKLSSPLLNRIMNDSCSNDSRRTKLEKKWCKRK